MFLKRIELSGFKSFADRTVFQFDQDITGIVGPNGCGKSNVTDAVRFVLGEQSAKSLRSSSGMSDLIFSGSQSRKPVNLARVSLVFDNTDRIFDSPFDEIEITREIHRQNSSVSCFINRTACRLKDISDLVLDTGLGRDSLSIITQGNISSFADAKPEERRLWFEEASGVAKYKKRKNTSLQRLDKVSANLERVMERTADLIEQRDVLEEQAKTAKEYTAVKEELSSLEISYLAKQGLDQKQALEHRKEALEEDQNQLSGAQSRLAAAEQSLEELQKKSELLQERTLLMSKQISTAESDVHRLQTEKALADERMKHMLEHGDTTQKIESLQAMIADARHDLSLQERQIEQVRKDRTQKQDLLEMCRKRSERAAGMKSSLQENIIRLNEQLQSIQGRLAGSQGYGTKEVLKHQRELQGVHGLVETLILPKTGFDLALNAALGSASSQIVTENEQNARAAIEFLKQRRSGRATFLPLTVCKSRGLQPWQLDTLKSVAGIQGTMDHFVLFQPKFAPLAGRLLGNIALADSMDSALMAAKKLKHSLKIVTLDGDVIHAGGAMSGGSNKAALSKRQMQQQADALSDKIAKCRADIEKLNQEAARYETDGTEAQQAWMDVSIQMEKLQSLYALTKSNFDDLNRQLAQLDGKKSNHQDSHLLEELEKAQTVKASLEEEQAKLDSKRKAIGKDLSDRRNTIRELRREISALSSSIQSAVVEIAKLETRLEQTLNTLSADYSLTHDAALAKAHDVNVKTAASEVRKLKNRLKEFGDVNLSAPAQYEKLCQDVEFYTQSKEELEAAAAEIRQAIEKLDSAMASQFQENFEKINGELQGVFSAMFGGGTARLSLSDPSNVIESGIEIDVQPPGKSIKSLNTFSGGEKALIAISVLFAMLKARRVPLCIFDEVEAALDQANVEKFARYLGQYRDKTQFLVVTHRPGTMEQCQQLYGVTMKKDGVSTVLKVLLQDALARQ